MTKARSVLRSRLRIVAKIIRWLAISTSAILALAFIALATQGFFAIEQYGLRHLSFEKRFRVKEQEYEQITHDHSAYVGTRNGIVQFTIGRQDDFFPEFMTIIWTATHLGWNLHHNASTAKDTVLVAPQYLIGPRWLHVYAYRRTMPRVARRYGSGNDITADYLCLAFPIVVPIVLLSIWPTVSLIKWRRGRTQPGHCPACGYDLRASPGRCPECGKVPSARLTSSN